MASREVTVRVSAQDNFSQTMDRYNRQMGAAEQATRRADQANQQATQGFGRLGTAIGGAIAAIGIQQVISFAEDFNELGNQVNITTQTFEQLIGEFGDADTIMLRLQDVTGGIVDNMTLMSGASRLASMGLATNSAEVERLTELAVRLGGAMGNDAAASIENFSLLLANESVLRLDSFGISSARVRTRIDELLASGEALNRSEAFRLAVLEEGGRSLERLGDAASAAETPLARLQTTLENIAQQGASNFATGVNATIAFVEDIAGLALTENQLNEQAVQWLMAQGAAPQGNLFGNAVFTQDQIEQARQAIIIQEAFAAEMQAGLDAQLAAEAAQRNATAIVEGYNTALATTVDLQSALTPIIDAGTAAWEQTIAVVAQVQEAYSNISLGQLLGEGQGNLALGGIGDMVIAELNARGTIDADALQQAADAYNLAAGRITESSITMRDIVAPILADITMAQGGEVGAQRAGQVEGFFRNMAATGQQDNVFTPLFAELATGTFAGIDFQGLILEPYQEAFADIVADFGPDSELAMAATDALSGLPTGVETAKTETEELQGLLDTMTAQEYRLRFAVDMTEIDALLAKIGQVNQAQAGALGQVVRDNGGVVPGADPRGHGPIMTM